MLDRKKIKVFCSLLLVLVVSAQGQETSIHWDQGSLIFAFQAETGRSYKICSSPDLDYWGHVVTVRGDDRVDWNVPASELVGPARFFRAEKVVAQGLEHLTEWNVFRAVGNGRLHIGLIGDSYTHNRARYSKPLKQMLTSQFGNLGAGYCSFSFSLSSGRNGSVDNQELDCTLDYSQWTRQYIDGYGPDAGHIVSAVDCAVVDVQVKKSIDSLRLMYVKSPGTGGFRYKVAGGNWTDVASDASLENAEKNISLHGYTAPYTVQIETPVSGAILLGCEAIITGDGVVVHKLAASGARAEDFVNNEVARDAIESLNLDMGVIMFGTNEQLASRSLESYRLGLKNIADTLREGNATIDLVFILPCYTKYEIESPRKYKLQEYGQVMSEVAQEYNASFLDLTEVFGPAHELQNLIDAGLMSSDRVHPATGPESGGELIADTIYGDILGL